MQYLQQSLSKKGLLYLEKREITPIKVNLLTDYKPFKQQNKTYPSL